MYRFQILVTCMQNIRPKHLDIIEEFALDDKKDAFSEVIKTMKRMEKIAVPNKKFELMTIMKEQILKEVQDSFETQNAKKQKKDEMKIIDVDNFVMILEYCVIKTVDKRLLIQRRLIDEFTNKNFLIYGERSYLYQNFQLAIEHILHLGRSVKEGKAQDADILKKSDQLFKLKQLEKIYWQEAKTMDTEVNLGEKDIDQVNEFIKDEFTDSKEKLPKSNSKPKIPKLPN